MRVGEMSGGHGTLKLMAADGVKVYCVSGGKKLPEWVNEKKERRKLAKDVEYRCGAGRGTDARPPHGCSPAPQRRTRPRRDWCIAT